MYSVALAASIERVSLYAGTTGGSVTSVFAQSSDLVNGALVGTSVYRFTTLPPKQLF